MTTPPDFTAGQVLTAAQINAGGLWRITTCTVSSAGGTAATASNGVITVGTGNTSVTISNAFSADFENYKIVFSGGQNSVAEKINLQLTSSGTVSNTGYYGTLVWVSVSTAAVSGAADNNASQFSFAGGGAGPNNGATSLDLDLLSPFLAIRTRLHNAQTLYGTVYGTYTGLHDVASSYDGFKLTIGAGTMTGGTIRVYGYRN